MLSDKLFLKNGVMALQSFVIACVKNQIVGLTRIENLKALYSFYENTGICFTCLSSSRKSSNWPNVTFKSLCISNCDWEVQAFPKHDFNPSRQPQALPCAGISGRSCPQCLGSISNIWNHLGTYHMQGRWWLLCQPQFLMHTKCMLGYVICPPLKSFWIQHEYSGSYIEQNSLGDFVFPVQMPRGTHSVKKYILWKRNTNMFEVSRVFPLHLYFKND